MATRKKLPIEADLERLRQNVSGVAAFEPKTELLNAILRLENELREFPYPHSRKKYQALFSILSKIFGAMNVTEMSQMFDHFEKILLDLDNGGVHTIIRPSFRPQNRPPLTDGEWSSRAYLAIGMRRLIHQGFTAKRAANFLLKEGPWVIRAVGLPAQAKAVISIYRQFKSGAVKNEAALEIYNSAPIECLTIEDEFETFNFAIIRGISWGNSKHSEAARKYAAKKQAARKRAAKKPPT